MDKKTTGVVATVLTVLFCGCPGLFAVCLGMVAAATSQIPGAEVDVFGSNDPQSALIAGIATFCVGILFVAIPAVVGFFTLRKKPAPVMTPDEPIPPAI